jgi:hypothetical protein
MWRLGSCFACHRSFCPHSRSERSWPSSTLPPLFLLPARAVSRQNSGFCLSASYLSRPTLLLTSDLPPPLLRLFSVSLTLSLLLPRYASSLQDFSFYPQFVRGGWIELGFARSCRDRPRCRALRWSRLRPPSETCFRGGTMPPLQVIPLLYPDWFYFYRRDICTTPPNLGFSFVFRGILWPLQIRCCSVPVPAHQSWGPWVVLGASQLSLPSILEANLVLAKINCEEKSSWF